MKQRIAFIGVGLIGGSLALAVRQAGLYDEICGFDSDLDNLQLALELGVIDDAMSSIHEILESAQLVVIATPVGVIKPVLQAIKPYWNSDCVYTDVGSTKQSVIHDLQDVFGELPANFVPGHPVAGTEQSGSGAAFAELYRNKHVILTPGQSTSESAVQRVRELWGRALALSSMKCRLTIMIRFWRQPVTCRISLHLLWLTCYQKIMMILIIPGLQQVGSRILPGLPAVTLKCGLIFVWRIGNIYCLCSKTINASWIIC